MSHQQLVRSPASEATLDELVRFCHPRKILACTRLPAPHALDDAVLAALYGTSEAVYRDVRARIATQVRYAAGALAGHAALRPGSLPEGTRLLAVGDSITDDAGSWAEMVAEAAGSTGIEVVNAGISGDTTADVVARSARLPRADTAVVLLGTNDARRHGRDGGVMLVGDAETLRNARALDRLLRRRCRSVLWVTPPPVLERRIDRHAGLREGDVTWRLADVRRKADLLRRAFPGAIDLWSRFGDPPAGELLLPDGLHPSTVGQLVIARAILDALEQAR